MQRIFAVNCSATAVSCASLPHPNTDNTIHLVLNIVFGVAVSIALLMIVIAGFRYVVAKGDANNMAKAKNTIVYALIGLMVTLVAYSIVTFVVKGLS